MNKKSRFTTILAIITVLVSGAFLALQVFQAQQPTSIIGANWEFMNYGINATDFNPQNQINSANVNNLRLAWLFPFTSAINMQGLAVGDSGTITLPLVVNGTVHVETNFLRVYAINATDGGVLWSYDPTSNTSNLPLAPLIGHVHGINYYEDKIWLRLPDCSIETLDALTGVVDLDITRICANVPGNGGQYDTDATSPVFYNNTLITGASVSDGTDSGRGFVAAYNITDGQMLWRWFISPPAAGGFKLGLRGSGSACKWISCKLWCSVRQRSAVRGRLG